MKFFVFILFISAISCGTLDPFNQSQKELDVKIKTFNFEFESKAFDRSARFVHPDYRGDFLKKTLEVSKKTSFLEASTLDLKFLLNDKSVSISPDGPTEEFNKAELTIRYQLSILPSTKLKTIVVKQEWIKLNNTWFVIPDIDSFLN